MLSAGKKEDIPTPPAATVGPAATELPLAAELSSVLQLLEDPACLLHSDGRLLAANPAMLALLKVPAGQLHHYTLTSWLPTEEQALLKRKLLLAKTRNQPYQANVRLKQPDGAPQPYQLRLQAAGNALVLLAKKACDTASQQFEEVTTASLVYDKQFNIIRYNQHFCHMLGYSEEKLQKIDLISLLHPDQLPLFTGCMRSLVRRDQKGFTCELQLRHHQQYYIWIQYTATLQEPPGEEPYITAVALDISQLKQKEDHLVQEQQDMSLFIDRVTHDMKGPLGSLMALHRLVEIEYGHDPKVMEYFNHYHATVERLNTTVADLLTLSRVKKGAPRLGLVNLRNMVQDCLQSLCHLPDFYKITFTIRIEIKESLFVEETLLHTIIQNLLENAIKYCSESSPKVLVCIRMQNEQLQLEVSDNGMGIPEEAQPFIFDMFYRATTRSTGTGLGLYILKNAVDKLKGTIKVRSLPRKGSRFIISLPYQAPEDQQERL